ncbi:hypothetical protein ACHAXA_005408 [Cyclostephanos tholiformis]|uniref:Uncharacterized protein n=1 Tax=Cyclostephanos tholiformis TaxID=382380 RepID=A0ABD3RE57_9STRA
MLETIVRSVNSFDVDDDFGGEGGWGGVRVATERGDFHCRARRRRARRLGVRPRAVATASHADATSGDALVPPIPVYAKGGAYYSSERFPVYIWHYGSGVGDYFHGFPCMPGERFTKMPTDQ